MSLSDDSLLLSQKKGLPKTLDITEENFAQEVLEGSVKTPFLLEFFSEEDSASTAFLPVLEEAVGRTEGFVRLGRMDIFKNRLLTRQLLENGLPLNQLPLTVLFTQSKIIDLFQGRKTADSLYQFLENALKKIGLSLPNADILPQALQALKENRPEEACAYFGEILEKSPEHPQAWAGLVRALIAMGEVEGAREALADLPESLAENEEIKGAKAALHIAEKKETALSELELLEKQVANAPEDIGLRYRFAEALNAAGHAEKAADILLSLIEQKKEEKERAKEMLLHFFEAWGQSELTRHYRRKLSSLLFA